jgi:RNA polymerase sigma-70 factor (ECF subfamily)
MFPSKSSNDDRDLVGRARRGDREAFTQLIMQYQVPLYNMALRMVGRPDDAADIAQEAFLRAWEKIRTLREAPFKSWLFQIAANLCYDHFRRGKRYGVMPDEDQTSYQSSNVVGLGIATPDPQERAEANERTRLVRESIQALDHDMRIAIVLRDVNGMAYDEIASVLRVPLGTVKSRIARARAQVQEQLQRHPDFFPTREDAHAD